MAKKGSNSFKGAILSGIMIIILSAGILGWAKVNDISSVKDVYGYFKSLSDKAWECGAGEAEWNCDTSLNVKDRPGRSTGDSGGGENSVPSDPTESRDGALNTLESITVAEPAEIDYNRSEWRHWLGSPCNTRETVLKQQGENVKADEKTCKILSGSWVDPYSTDVYTDASKLDIDHIIPLGYAARHGGQDWDSDLKKDFANDVSNLLAVSAGENRSKSDKGPSGYMPPNKDFHCEYGKIWVSVASEYELSITGDDKSALTSALEKCS